MTTLCLHTAWNSEDLSFLAKVLIWSSQCYQNELIVPGPAVSPGQCETDTKPFHQLKEPQEMRGKPAKPEARLILVWLTGRTTNHEVIIHVFQYERETIYVRINLRVKKTEKAKLTVRCWIYQHACKESQIKAYNSIL